MDFDSDLVKLEVARLFASSEIEKHRLMCQCRCPSPGRFDDMHYANCQICGNRVSKLMMLRGRGG